MYSSKLITFNIVLTIIIIIITSVSKINCICIEQICDTLQDVPLENVKLHWTYVHFRSWFPSNPQVLPANFFIEYNHLKYLTFKKILKGMHKDSLGGLISLETIVFQDNFLVTLPKDLFKYCPKLEKIVVRNCQLTTVNQGTFHNLEYLEHLKIENNNLTDIKNGVIPKHLIELILSNNQITYIEENVFYDMHKLQILDLSENYLTTFEFKKYLINTPRLHSIKIGGNYLEFLTPLPNLSNLKYFYIENNSISILDNFIFETSLNLEVINLADNNLNVITADNFASNRLKKMNKLYLSYNNLKCIDISLLKLFPNLKILWIGMNNLNCSCYNELETYIINNSIKNLYNFEIEIEKYNICKQQNNSFIHLL